MVAIIIVEHAYRSTAESLVEQLYPASDGQSFTVPLCPVGSQDVTHWACLPICSDAILASIQQLAQMPQFVGHVHVSVCEPVEVADQFAAVCQQRGLMRHETGWPE